MADAPKEATVQATIDLNQGKYQTSLNTFSALVRNSDMGPFILAGVRTPTQVLLEIQVRHSDIYVIGFKGADGWYSFEDQPMGWGQSCGVPSNYSQLGTVGTVSLSDLIALGNLAQFKKGSKIDRRLCAILFSVVSEATRFASASTYFTGMTNDLPSQYPGARSITMNFEQMRATYFNHWSNPPDSAKVRNNILVPADRFRS